MELSKDVRFEEKKTICRDIFLNLSRKIQVCLTCINVYLHMLSSSILKPIWQQGHVTVIFPKAKMMFYMK